MVRLLSGKDVAETVTMAARMIPIVEYLRKREMRRTATRSGDARRAW